MSARARAIRRLRATIAITLAPAFAALACGEQAEAPALQELGATRLATGAEQTQRLCSRGRSDVVLDAFCRREPPRVESLLDLRRELKIDHPAYKQDLAVLSHSTALSSRAVSAINPRLFLINERKEGGPELTILAFVRGEQFAEAVVQDRVSGELQFYLITYQQDCNEDGCTPGDLLTEEVEVGWRNVNVYAEEDLVNTPLDCRVCHQPDGPRTPKLLRMQELAPPWNHWLYPFVPGGRAVAADYVAAKDGELFGGLTATEIADRSNPGVLTAMLTFVNATPQPNEFKSSQIEREVNASAAERGGNQPVDNSVPGQSSTWNALYERAKRGEAISVPYHDVKITDAQKLAEMTQAYRDYLEGVLPREQLPDIRNVLPDDELLLARMGFATEPGASGEEVLLQACGQCHNDSLDQSLTRARFNVDLKKMSRTEKDRAIERVQLALDHASVMPPARFRHLSDEAKARLIELLER